jgi:hypothetical protein
MKRYLLMFLFLCNGYDLSGQSFYKENIANLISVSFPLKPFPSETLGNSVIQAIDSSAMYSVINISVDPKQLLFYADKLPEFYDGVINGYAESYNARVIEKKEFEVSGFRGIEVELLTSPDPKLPDLRYVRVLLLNNSLIAVNFWTLSENKQATETARKRFFNSIVVTADQKTATQGTSPAGHQIGYLLGKLVFWTLLAGIVAAVILLIRRLRRKKHSTMKSE